jgi:hypothetical protein
VKERNTVKLFSAKCSPISGGRFPGFFAFPPDKSPTKIERQIQHWWNNTEKGKMKCSEKYEYLSECHFLHHKSHKNWVEIKPGSFNFQETKLAGFIFKDLGRTAE